jgi:hypothetical protein
MTPGFPDPLAMERSRPLGPLYRPDPNCEGGDDCKMQDLTPTHATWEQRQALAIDSCGKFMQSNCVPANISWLRFTD